MSENGYDVAQICLNGHVINSSSASSPLHNKKFCDKCGAQTITHCQYCDKSIQGYYHSPYIIIGSYNKPNFCHECGKPYPWTEAKLSAAKELSDEFENLSPHERETLKKSLDDIIIDTPHTPVATTRFKKLMAKAGKVAADSLKEIIIDVASEATKKAIWGS